MNYGFLKLLEGAIVKSKNEAGGYAGEFSGNSQEGAKRFQTMHARLSKVFKDQKLLDGAEDPNMMVTDFLDSNYGRHLADDESRFGDDEQRLHASAVKSFKSFKKSYEPNRFY